MQIEDITENRMFNPKTMEVRSAGIPADLAASVKAKNEARTQFTPEARAAAERRLKEVQEELETL
jgi:hypothetical protein